MFGDLIEAIVLEAKGAEKRGRIEKLAVTDRVKNQAIRSYRAAREKYDKDPMDIRVDAKSRGHRKPASYSVSDTAYSKWADRMVARGPRDYTSHIPVTGSYTLGRKVRKLPLPK